MRNKLVRRLIYIQSLLAGLLMALCINAYCQTYPAVYTDKMATTPDILQTDPESAYVQGGTHCCGPAAMSNVMMCLVNNGFTRLCQPAQTAKQSQFEVIKKLASTQYIDNNPTGASPSDIMRGTEKYIADAGYRCVRLEYQGWRNVSKVFRSGIDIPRLDWMKEIVSNPTGGLCLNIGFYNYSKESNTFKRVGGHWITVVGYGVDSRGEMDPNVIIVHDPASRSLKHPNEYCRLVPISNGSTLTGEIKGLPRPADGYYIVEGDLHVYEDADVDIIDCAVGLVVK